MLRFESLYRCQAEKTPYRVSFLLWKSKIRIRRILIASKASNKVLPAGQVLIPLPRKSVSCETGDISSIWYPPAVDEICLRHIKERILSHIWAKRKYIIRLCRISYRAAIYHLFLRLDEIPFLRNWWYTALRADDIQCCALIKKLRSFRFVIFWQGH